MAQNPQLQRATALRGSAKLSAVTNIIDRLSDDLTNTCFQPHERDAALEELKIYGRDPTDAGPIFTKKGIETLARHAFQNSSSNTYRNALRCLCNALLLNVQSRQIFVNLGFEEEACAKLKNDNREDEFLVSRLLLLSTYVDKVDLSQLIKKYNIENSITMHLERHTEIRSAADPAVEPMADLALIETLKLLFNITHFCSDQASAFTPAIPHIVTLLCKSNIRTGKPLDHPIMSMINCLLNLDLGAKDISPFLYPQSNPNFLADRLLDLLAQSTGTYKDEELDSTVTALIGVLRGLHEYGPEETRSKMRQTLLPTEADRNEVLGRSDSLPSWLLKNSTNALAPQLRKVISKLLFELSNKDASQLVENVGYGWASGLIFNENLPLPQTASEAHHDPQTGASRPINPVTGQFLDSETQSNAPEMTEEEREREAERLFVLFERLRANGVISVENPVRTAQHEGRFEELPDDFEE